MEDNIKLIDTLINQKIEESVIKRQISRSKATGLIKWWNDFVQALQLPEKERIPAITKVVMKGVNKFEEEPLLKFIMEIFLPEEPKTVKCSTCNGTGYITCYRCNGRGSWYIYPPSGIIALPFKDYCTACYGRGRDPCYACKGTGIIEKSGN